MSAFQPDGLFLKRSGNGYKGKVLQYNSAAVVDAHVEHGYLVHPPSRMTYLAWVSSGSKRP